MGESKVWRLQTRFWVVEGHSKLMLGDIVFFLMQVVFKTGESWSMLSGNAFHMYVCSSSRSYGFNITIVGHDGKCLTELRGERSGKHTVHVHEMLRLVQGLTSPASRLLTGVREALHKIMHLLDFSPQGCDFCTALLDILKAHYAPIYNDFNVLLSELRNACNVW